MFHTEHDATQDADSSSQVAGTRSRAERFAAFRAAFWKFLRPHTIRGTILGATAITSRALLENQQVDMHLGQGYRWVGDRLETGSLGRLSVGFVSGDRRPTVRALLDIQQVPRCRRKCG